MKTRLRLEKTTNGYIVMDGPDTELIEDTGDEKDCISRLLYRVAEWAGCDYQKYGSENLNITFDKKGHKLE